MTIIPPISSGQENNTEKIEDICEFGNYALLRWKKAKNLNKKLEKWRQHQTCILVIYCKINYPSSLCHNQDEIIIGDL